MTVFRPWSCEPLQFIVPVKKKVEGTVDIAVGGVLTVLDIVAVVDPLLGVSVVALCNRRCGV